MERINDLGADAIRHARTSLDYLEEFPPDLYPSGMLTVLQKAVMNRNVLTELFREAATSILHSLSCSDVDPSDFDDIRAAQDALSQALEYSNRVSDLVATENLIRKLKKF
nr:hypothetical protein [uncultured Cohaesibacter sp.]